MATSVYTWTIFHQLLSLVPAMQSIYCAEITCAGVFFLHVPHPTHSIQHHLSNFVTLQDCSNGVVHYGQDEARVSPEL